MAGKSRLVSEDKKAYKDPFLATPVEPIKEETNEASRLSMIDSPTTSTFVAAVTPRLPKTKTETDALSYRSATHLPSKFVAGTDTLGQSFINHKNHHNLVIIEKIRKLCIEDPERYRRVC